MTLFASSMAAYHDDGYAAWLRYAPLPEEADVLPRRLVVVGEGLEAAFRELRWGIERLFGRTIVAGGGWMPSPEDPPPDDAPSLWGGAGVGSRASRAPTALERGESATPSDSYATLPQGGGHDLGGGPGSLVLGTCESLGLSEVLRPDGFLIRWEGRDLIVAGADARGALYGAFALLRRLPLGLPLETREEPSAEIRFVNHWDNPDGSIERGYAGRSIFYGDDGHVTDDLARVTDYARLLASVGINGCSLNNVNANDWVYHEGLAEVARLAGAMRPYGVRPLISVRFDSPLRDLETYDPLNEEVAEWWRAKVAEIYRHIPDLAGLVIKADSEGEAGPSATGRTHADAANMLARALAPHGGLIFYRGFVYDHRMDWRDRTLDRAKAQYDNFKPLDGLFEPNAVVQIKNGPIDFQVREPASPSFAGLEKTATVIEFMITQEYLGQQRHTVYEVPWWKDTLEFDFGPFRVVDAPTRRGFVAVCGVGRDRNWMGNHLAQANLYGYGRLAWDPSLSSEAIAEEWAAATLTREPEAVGTVRDLLMRTWPAYEDYTGNLGVGGLTDIIHVHYGPSPVSSEHNGWGQWHRSDEHGTGMDRTVATGTGMTAQYPTPVFESLDACPEELLLFFHHVPYTHRLRGGSTVIQAFYDRHYAGAEEAARFPEAWRSLRGRIDERRFLDVLAQLEYQAGHALVWRDAVCQWFARLSGIPDEKGRVFGDNDRLEAEAMHLEGYEIVEIEPWEAASGGRAVALTGPVGQATHVWTRATGVYDLAVWYFDPTGGRARFELWVDERLVDSWVADQGFPSARLDGHTRTRRIVRGLEIAAGDALALVGRRDGSDPAGLDFIQIL